MSSTSMSPEKLIRKEPHCYCLVFLNSKALDQSTIQRIFSKYGDVISITAAGDNRGYRFVRYATLEEAQRAVDNVQNDSDVMLKYHRPKSGFKAPNSNNDKTKNSSSNWKRPNVQVWQHEIETNSDCGSCNESTSDEPRNRPLSSEQRTPSTTSLQYSKQPTTSIDDALKELHRELSKCGFTRRTSDSESVPSLVSRDRKLENVVITAGEIVVGNIPDRFGPAYFLHLFEEHQPIAISYIRSIPNINVKYCYVYFASLKDALKVEQQFDKYDLEGSRLVVMRPEKLAKIGVV